MKNRRVLLKLMLAVSAFLVAACGNSSSGSNIQNRTDSEISDNSTYQPESMVEEEKILHSLMENDFEELYSLECSYYNVNYDEDSKKQVCEQLLLLYEQLGVDVSTYTPDSLFETIQPLCEQNGDNNIFSVAGIYLGADFQKYINVYDDYIKYTVLEQYHFGGYYDAGKDNWFGETTDEQRLAASTEIINCFAEIGYDINITPEELTEKLNEFYNQGNDDINVLEAALQFLPQNIKFDDILSMWNEYRIMNLDFE